jgi:uncharacterized membrane protein YbhN (UPF0104 family)
LNVDSSRDIPPQSKQKNTWRVVRVVGTVLSLALLAWLLAQQNWKALLNGIRSIPPLSLLAALALLAARHFTFALRWTTLLQAQQIHVPYWAVLKLQYASLFASNFLPTTVGGDVARLAGVLPRSHDKVAGTASIIVDRVLGAFGMLFVLPFSWPLVSGLLGLAAPLSTVAAKSALGLLKRGWDQLWSALGLWIKKPRSLLLALGASWLGILFYLVAIWLMARDLNMPVGFGEVAGATALTYFISLIPFSINAYGLRELSIVFFYTQLGSSPEQSAALALLTRLILITISLPGALALGGILEGVLGDRRRQ